MTYATLREQWRKVADMAQPAGWRKSEYGYLSANGDWFIERGAPMFGGGTAWLVWHRTDDVDESGSFSPSNGQTVRSLTELAGEPIEGDASYAHVGDAGSLQEAVGVIESGRPAWGYTGKLAVKKDTWHFDPQDSDYDKRILRSNKSSQTTRRKFPAGTRVLPQHPDADPTYVGTVKRHVPGHNAQGGYLLVEWPNGVTGRHGPISLRRAED